MKVFKETLKFITGIVFLLLSGCYYDNQETLYPQSNTDCDLTQVTFNLTIKPIISNNCLACHSNSQAAANGGGVKLELYADVKKVVDSGKLWGVVSHTSGFTPMPLGMNKLNDCTLKKIKKWIDNGAQNN